MAPSLTAANASSSPSKTRAGPRVLRPPVAGELHDAALRREVAAEDGQAAGRLQRIVERPDDLLPLSPPQPSAASSPSVRPVTVVASACMRPASTSRFATSRTPTGAVEVRRPRTGRRASGRRSAASASRSGRSRRSSARRRPRGPPRAGGAPRWWSLRWRPPTRSRSRALRVMIIALGRRSSLDQLHDQAAAVLGDLTLAAPSSAGTIPLPIGEMPSASNASAIVLAVNCPPQAPAPGERCGLELGQLVVVDARPRRARRPPRRRPGSSRRGRGNGPGAIEPP